MDDVGQFSVFLFYLSVGIYIINLLIIEIKSQINHHKIHKPLATTFSTEATPVYKNTLRSKNVLKPLTVVVEDTISVDEFYIWLVQEGYIQRKD